VFLYEEYQSSYPDYFFRETTKRIYLEEQYKQAREEEREIVSRIQQLQTELKQLAHESVQGNLSALPAEYRIARKQGKSVAEAMAIAKAAKEAAKAAKSIQPSTP
jgi:competence protein ComGC